jgi:hypothetical protein
LKNYFILFLCIFSIEKSNGQQKQIYKSAFIYLQKHNKAYQLHPADTLVKIEITDFYQELSREWGIKEERTIQILDSIGQVRICSQYGLLALKFGKLNTSHPVKYVYFSEIFDHMLIAEVLSLTKNAKLSYRQQTQFKESKKYLFIIDKRNKFKKVFEKLIQYN